MKRSRIRNQLSAFERAVKKAQNQEYRLRLYVTGITPKSLRAISNIKELCERHLQGRYKLEVVDIYQQPILAKGDQIIAAPTLIKYLPAPLRRLIGDMANTERILLGLDLRPKLVGKGPSEKVKAKSKAHEVKGQTKKG